MDHEGYVRAANHWKAIDAETVKMPKEELLKKIEEYVTANNTCALATGSGNQIRNTPIEYKYRDGAFWMFSEGGEKFLGLEKNKNVCIAVFDKYAGFAKLKGLQVQGRAEIVKPFSEEYLKAAEYRKIPVEMLKKLPEPMNLLKVVPERMDFTDSDLKKAGYGVRQEYVVTENSIYDDI